MSATERSLIGPPGADLARAEQDQQDVLAGKGERGRGRFNSRLAFILAGALGISSLVIACSPDAKAGAQPSQPPTETPVVTTIIQAPTPEQPRPTATATSTAVPTETPKPEATATVTPQKEPEPPATATLEVKKFDCGILSPEACATGEYVQWKVPSGRMVTGMAFQLKQKESIKIPENLQVAGVDNPLYNGYGITSVTEGKRYLYLGDIKPVEKDGKPVITNFGRNLSAGTVVATIAGSGAIVFKDTKINFLIIYPTEDELKATFSEQTKTAPRTVILNSPPNLEPSRGATFFGVKPPS